MESGARAPYILRIERYFLDRDFLDREARQGGLTDKADAGGGGRLRGQPTPTAHRLRRHPLPVDDAAAVFAEAPASGEHRGRGLALVTSGTRFSRLGLRATAVPVAAAAEPWSLRPQQSNKRNCDVRGEVARPGASCNEQEQLLRASTDCGRSGNVGTISRDDDDGRDPAVASSTRTLPMALLPPSQLLSTSKEQEVPSEEPPCEGRVALLTLPRSGRNPLAPLIVAEAEDEIARRVEEINEMRKRRCDIASILPELSTAQAKLVKSLSSITTKEFRLMRRRAWMLRDYFRNAARVVLLIVKGFSPSRRRYHRFDPKGAQIQRTQRRSNAFYVTRGRESGDIAPGMTLEMRLALSSQPCYRRKEEVTKIMWMARAMHAFQKMFAEDMELEMARRVAYDKFDDKRLVAYQGRSTDRIYFVLSGKLSLLAEYELHTGIVTRCVGQLTPGQHTDPDAVEQAADRQCHLVASGSVELMSLDKKDFLQLTKHNEGLPLGFIKGLELFREFPLERLNDWQDAMTLKYYRQEKIICQDSNRSQWIFVIRSGKVKVIRQQPIYESQLEGSMPNTLLRKEASHASVMLGVLPTQQKLKRLLAAPEDYQKTLTNNRNNYLLAREPLAQYQQQHKQKRQRRATTDRFLKKNSPSRQSYESYTVSHLLSTEEKERRSPMDRPLFPDIDTPVSSSHHPSDWSSFDKSRPANTPATAFSFLSMNKKEEKMPKTRDSYVQLDILTKGCVYGLDHLHEAKYSEGVGLTLLSDGAEVVAISKRFFIQNATNNTMLKVETMFKEYMSADEVQKLLLRDETWNRYRNVILEKTVTSVAANHVKSMF